MGKFSLRAVVFWMYHREIVASRVIWSSLLSAFFLSSHNLSESYNHIWLCFAHFSFLFTYWRSKETKTDRRIPSSGSLPPDAHGRQVRTRGRPTSRSGNWEFNPGLPRGCQGAVTASASQEVRARWVTSQGWNPETHSWGILSNIAS